MVRIFIHKVRSHSLVCIENHLFIVGIGPILNKELEPIFDLIALIVRAFIVRYLDCTINYIYKRKEKYVVFWILKCNAYRQALCI